VWDAEQLRRTLEGALVRLEPLREQHREPLREAASDPEIWRWMPLNASASAEMFARYFDRALERGETEMFATIDRASGVAIGATGYHALRPEHRGLEIGGTWLRPASWRSGANVETKLLLLEHAFGELDCIRVEFKTDALNERSRKAIEGIGARYEGIFRSHMIVRVDVIRDSAYYSVIASEWPAVRRELRERLARHDAGAS
jgi:RimJ/RimL family protein N-acetyltransferase